MKRAKKKIDPSTNALVEMLLLSTARLVGSDYATVEIKLGRVSQETIAALVDRGAEMTLTVVHLGDRGEPDTASECYVLTVARPPGAYGPRPDIIRLDAWMYRPATAEEVAAKKKTAEKEKECDTTNAPR